MGTKRSRSDRRWSLQRRCPRSPIRNRHGPQHRALPALGTETIGRPLGGEDMTVVVRNVAEMDFASDNGPSLISQSSPFARHLNRAAPFSCSAIRLMIRPPNPSRVDGRTACLSPAKFKSPSSGGRVEDCFTLVPATGSPKSGPSCSDESGRNSRPRLDAPE
jgi:hypothetical protein